MSVPLLMMGQLTVLMFRRQSCCLAPSAPESDGGEPHLLWHQQPRSKLSELARTDQERTKWAMGMPGFC